MSAPPRIFKLVAAGNDFLVVDARAHGGMEWSADEARLACRRQRGMGADGVVTLGPSAVADATFNLRNSDGSRAAFSGNGARCAARLLAYLGADRDGGIRLETSSGVLAARVLGERSAPAALVEVEVAPPKDIRLGLALPSGSPAPRGDYAIVGVPYVAVPVTSVDDLDLAAVAPRLRHWKECPEGANVAFYEPPASDGSTVRLRIWERGVEGETLSSGTGCAMIATMEGGVICRLLLRGDALLLGEIHAGVDLFTADP